MNGKKIKGIEQFRLVAAIMVIAIHTFPFGLIDSTLNILLTLTLFRIAVPFFLLVTGYFVLGNIVVESRLSSKRRYQLFIKRQFKFYLLVTLLYVPLAIFNSNLSLDISVLQLIKLFVFEGVVYHLWYFPAVMLGSLIVITMLKYFSLKLTIIVSSLLYIVGVFGDSWYGFIREYDILKNFYEVLFELTGYTRNGIFFVPLFLCIGIYLRKVSQQDINVLELEFFSILFLFILICEGYFVHRFSTPKHDSMYFSLPFVMLFIFPLISNWYPKIHQKFPKEKSMIMYVIHPWFIAVVYFVSRWIFLIKYSFINFIVVVGLSYYFSFLVISLRKRGTFPSKEKILELLKLFQEKLWKKI